MISSFASRRQVVPVSLPVKEDITVTGQPRCRLNVAFEQKFHFMSIIKNKRIAFLGFRIVLFVLCAGLHLSIV